MAEEYFVQNPDQVEGGIEIPDETFDAIQIVASNIDDIKLLADQISDTGQLIIDSIDGNPTTIQVRRGLSVDLTAQNPILALGEIGYPTDLSNPPVLKIGDGATTWDSLPNILLASSLTTDYLNNLLAQCESAAGASNTSADDSASSATTSAASALVAATNAQTAADWATAPATTVLPGGKQSSEVNADRAATTAQTSRYIQRATCSGTEDFTAGMLFSKRRYLGTSNMVVTLFANTFTSPDDVEAWAVYRKAAAGNIQFVASTSGSNLQAAVLKASFRSNFKNPTPSAAVNVSKVFPMAIPAITAGKLILVLTGSSTDSNPKTMTISLSGGLTATVRVPFAHFAQFVSEYTVWDCDLTSFAAATINATCVYGGNVNHLELKWFAIEGHGGAGVFPTPVSPATAASVSLTMSTVPQGSLILACTDMQGSAATLAVSNMGANMSIIASGTSAGDDDTAVTNTNVNKNHAWATGSAVAAATGNFTVTANFNSAAARPTLCCFYYPPKTVVGAGTVSLNLMGSRDTLNVLHGEAVLLFHPDGKVVTVLTVRMTLFAPYVYHQRMTPKFAQHPSTGVAILSITGITREYHEGEAISFVVRRANVINQACSATWTVSSSDSTDDLVPPFSGTVDFTTSSLINAAVVTVQTATRTGDQGLRQITVALGTPVNCAIDAALGSASVDFLDDVLPPAPAPLLTVTGSNARFVEGSSLQFLIRRTRSSLEECWVDWTAVSSFDSGDMSGLVNQTAYFPAGINEIAVNIQTINRPGVQSDRVITFYIGNPIGAEVDANQWFFGTTIYDRVVAGDPPVMQITGPTADFDEGSKLTFTVIRTHTLDQACQVAWSVTSTAGTADFSGATSGTVSFTNDPAVNQAHIDIQTVNRAGTQNDRDIVMTLGSPVNCVLDAAGNTYLVNLRDIAPVSINPPVLSVTGSVADFTEGDVLTFQIKRDVNFTTACSAHWVLSAVDAADLTGTTSGTVNFTTTPTANLIDITATTVKRTGTQGLRNITLTLSSPVNCSTDPDRYTFATPIQDFVFPADPPLISVTGSNSAIEEGNSLSFTIVRERAFNACSVGWAVASEVSGDLSGTTSGTASFPNDLVTNTRIITIATNAQSGNQNPRDVTLTLGATTNCELKPGGEKFAITLIDQGETFDKSNLFFNPHNAQSAHHRPFGAGIKWGFPPDVDNWDAATPSYTLPRGPGGEIGAGKPGRYFQNGDVSPLIADYIECAGISGHTGNAGSMVANAGAQGTKFFYQVDKTKTTNNFTIPFDGSVSGKTGSVTELWPTFPPSLGDLGYSKIVYFPVGTGPDKKDGDCNVMLYPENGVKGGRTVWWDELYLMPGVGHIARNRLTFPIDDVDYTPKGTQGGAGASQMYWPTHIMRGFELNGKFGVPRIQHALQATVCRHSKVGASARAHLMNQRNCWPAYGRDGSLSANTATENKGPGCYGSCWGIPPWLQYLRDSKPNNKAPGGYSFDLDDIGLALWDCFSDYGLRFLDGSGRVGTDRPASSYLPGTTANDYGRIEIRTDQGIGPFGTLAQNTLDSVTAALKKFMGFTNTTTIKTMCVLFPVANPRLIHTENEKVPSHNNYYLGNGANTSAGPLYTTAGRCQNTAYDAT